MKNRFKKIGLSLVVITTFLSSCLNAGNSTSDGNHPSDIVYLKNDYSSTKNKNILVKYKKQVQDYETLVVMYQSQFESYKSNLKKRKTLLPKQWKLFAKFVTNLRKAIEFSEGMNLAASSYELDLKKEFPSYETFSKSTQTKTSKKSIQNQYKQLRLASRDKLNTSLKLLGLEVQNVEDVKAIMEQLEILSKTSIGQASAIGVANKLALHQIYVLNELQKTMTLQKQIQSAFLSVN